MAITDRARKILWVKAGGRCSICRDQVVTEKTELDESSVFGEEAHIVARSVNGPRGRSDDVENDSYDNLILVCRKHHKQIDDQENYYTVERLHQIKDDHEHWVATLGREKDAPVRLIPDPTRPVDRHLRLFLTGTSLWNFFDGALSFQPSFPEDLDEETHDLVANFFDNLRDWMDIASDVDTFRIKRDAARSLGEQMKELAHANLFVGARERFLLLTGGVSEEPSSWRSIEIELQPMAQARVVDSEGNPLSFPPEEQS